MALDDVVGVGFAAIGRFIAGFFVDIVFELLIRGLGYGICRIFSRNVQADDFSSVVVGVFAWAAILAAGYALFV